MDAIKDKIFDKLNAFEDISPQECLAMFRHWRENNERCSDDVLKLGKRTYCESKGDNEAFLYLEQVLLAAVDQHDYAFATFYVKVLMNTFPGSLRVMKLNAIIFEAKEKYEDALACLDHIIKLDETNAPARKRRVAIFKAQGLITEAIKELVDYLKKFMSDVEAWQELSELYLSMQDYSRAAFCAEELILHQPHNHLMHQRLADIRYTMGGVENLEMAKSYYCQAVKLNPDNMRAILGLFLTTTNLLNIYKSSGNSSKRKEIWKLSQWAQAQATKKQNEAKSSAALTQMMLALAIE